MSNGPAILDGNVSIHIQKAGLRGLDRLASQMDGPLAETTMAELESLEKQILTIDETLRREGLVNECLSIEVMKIARSGSPEAKADLSPMIVVFSFDPRYLLTPKETMLAAQRRYYEALRAAASEPYWERGPLPAEPRDPLNTMLLTPLQGSIFAFDTTGACFQLVKIKLAARAYEASYGHPPRQLEDLTPRYASSIQDRFSGKPLRLRRDAVSRRQVIYSLGPDRDDDGGKPIKDAIRPDSDGDLTRVPDR